ncbi:MAG: hypothetical protein N3D12_04355, partial [Candidatus Methanomethyliaceae archaeon]|nr:hypothetical protein [Candidatus Methanomethyliaceae archaeon]
MSTLLLATLVLSVVAVAGVVPVRAAVGELSVSTKQFYRDAVVQVRLYDPDLNLNPNDRDVALLSITINCANGTTVGPIAAYANESLPNSGEFYFYFANASVGSTVTVQNPPYG